MIDGEPNPVFMIESGYLGGKIASEGVSNPKIPGATDKP